jgi:hypothetical protein
MKSFWWIGGLAVLALTAGCTSEATLEEIKQAAETGTEEALAEAKDELAATGEKAKADVEAAGATATAEVEGAGAEAKEAVEGAAADLKSALEGGLGDLANLKVGDVEIGKEATALAENLSTTLAEIKDVETAKAALPKLEEANLGLDKLLGAVDKIPEAARPAIASLLKAHSATIEATIQKVVAIEGVGEIVKPVLDQIVAKLNKASGAGNDAEPAAAP